MGKYRGSSSKRGKTSNMGEGLFERAA